MLLLLIFFWCAIFLFPLLIYLSPIVIYWSPVSNFFQMVVVSWLLLLSFDQKKNDINFPFVRCYPGSLLASARLLWGEFDVITWICIPRILFTGLSCLSPWVCLRFIWLNWWQGYLIVTYGLSCLFSVFFLIHSMMFPELCFFNMSTN